MNVVIALTSSSSQISGVQRHGINLARCLVTRNEITALHLVVASWQEECLQSIGTALDSRVHLHKVHLKNTSIARNVWFYSKLPIIAAELRADVVHLAYPMPVRRRAYHCPTVVTLHDLYVYDAPGNFGFPKVLFNEVVLHQCLKNVDAVACVSRSTRERLKALNALLAKKANVIANCVVEQSAVSVDSPVPGWRGEAFLLCVAQHRPNKNLILLLAVFKRLLVGGRIDATTRLVIVGIHGPETKRIQRYLAINQLERHVVLLTGISDEELQWCYRKCTLLIAPSLVEGFGLPVAEALLAGCHVICSDIPAFREVGGDHCEYIPLNEKAEQAFVDAVSAAAVRPKVNRVPLPQLSTRHIAEEYIRLYRSLLKPAISPDVVVLKHTIPASGRNTVL